MPRAGLNEARVVDEAASRALLQVVADVLAGYELRDQDAIDATRALRSALHGFVTLEAGGGFGLPLDVDRSFEKLVRALVKALSGWVEARPSQAGAPADRPTSAALRSQRPSASAGS
ncbi:MAG: TetR-like C-terminal domain-containing protein [Solirubrobacteraceae bacterium]|jgi:hypothetical protein